MRGHFLAAASLLLIFAQKSLGMEQGKERDKNVKDVVATIWPKKPKVQLKKEKVGCCQALKNCLKKIKGKKLSRKSF